MKLGKNLDLSKCFYDKDHWTHPDLKEGQLYIIQRLSDSGTDWFYCIEMPFMGVDKDKSPIQDGWKHIQEVIVEETESPSCGAEVDKDGYGGD